MSNNSDGRYRFGPRNQRGLFASLRMIQIVTLVATLTVAVLVARIGPPHQRLWAAVLVLVFGTAISLGQIAGRSVVEWIPEVGSFFQSGISGNRRVAYRWTKGGVKTKTASLFDSFQFLDIDLKGRKVGALFDTAEQTISAVLHVQGEPFALLDDVSRNHKTAEWARFLAALHADRSLFRLKWIHQTTPDLAADLRAQIVRATVQSAAQGEALHSYQMLEQDLFDGALRSDQYLVISTRPAKAFWHRRPETANELSDFASSVALVERRLAELGLRSRGALSSYGLAKMTQRLFDCAEHPTLSSSPWPDALEERWENIRTDNLWHVTYWIAEWPRSEVSSGFLLSLLLETSVRRSITLCMAPLPVERAIRAAEQRRTSSSADADLRRRYGFSLSSRVRSQHDAIVQREDELARGHVGYEFTGYVTVTADSPDNLTRACEQIEQSSALAHLELRRLFGMQRESLLYCQGNARGCP